MTLIDLPRFEQQLATVIDRKVGDTYRTFSRYQGPPNLVIRPSGHGYISKELRFERGGQWYCSAVLNKGWVLWYFRWPLFRDGLLDCTQTISKFPDAEVTKVKDVKVRITNPSDAQQILDWLIW